MGVARGVARILSFLSGARTDSFQVRGRGADFFFHFVGAILLLFVFEFMDLIQVPGRGADSFVYQILFYFLCDSGARTGSYGRRSAGATWSACLPS